MYALNLAEDGHVLSITYSQYAAADMPIVEALPEGNITDYRYAGGEYIYDPLPIPEPKPAQPTELEKLRADTDFLLAAGGYVK